MDVLTIKDLLSGGDILAWPVVIYLWRELQKLHTQRHAEITAQLALFQKIALKATGEE